MSKRITIKSIAKELGISHMTVSRALSGSPNVQKETRDAIQKHAAALGYVRSSTANALRGDKTNIVGLLLPGLVNEFYARFSDSLAQDCEQRGLQLIIHLTNDELAKEQQALLQLQEVHASAVVMVPSPGVLDNESRLLKGVKVIQFIRQREQAVPCSGVLVDDSIAIAQAVEHLLKKGQHRRIAYIGADAILSSGRERLSAFTEAMQNAGITPLEEDIFIDKPAFSMGHRCAKSIIAAAKATAVICGGVEISNGALNACLEQGLNLPKDLAFVGYGDPSYYQWIQGGVSTIRIPVHELAVNTAHILGESINSKADEPDTRILPAEFVVRASSAVSQNC